MTPKPLVKRKVKSSLVVFPDLTDKQVDKLTKDKGIGAMLSLMMHNQGVMNEKLNKILGSDNPLEAI